MIQYYHYSLWVYETQHDVTSKSFDDTILGATYKIRFSKYLLELYHNLAE